MEKLCQSCGMPLGNDSSLFGTEKDGSKNSDYCVHCYANGEYTYPVLTMDAMIELCAPYWAQNDPNITEEQATAKMKEFFPTLKRWQK